ncbi:MAG: bifunctional trypsin-like peptidase domain-containing/SEL1-like repeat protein [Burkholderiales bacterium]|nr:bifunctional trypsin-like peptidase domain-containing/SEL1-like repeat protein [Burkholderiales bacterium]
MCTLGSWASQALAQQLLFPESEWGKSRMALPQSASRLESLFQVADENFEPIAAFATQSPFRKIALPIGRLEIKARDRFGQVGVILCTASVISDRFVLTNHHCIPGLDGFVVLAAQLRMGYLSDQSPAPDVYPVALAPTETDARLDYSIVEVGNRPAARYGVVNLARQGALPGDDLFIVHHPLNKPLQLTRKDCRVMRLTAETPSQFAHRCHTLVGSSGAPLFSVATWQVVGLHFQGGASDTPDSYNAAKRLEAILARSPILKTLAVEAQAPAAADANRTARCDVTDAALLLLCQKARAGQADAQYEFGNRLHHGTGLARDDEAAVHWLKQAAQQGQAEAQANLGYMYDKGYGVPIDKERAVYWTQKAAAAGVDIAQFNLGEFYELGTGVAADLSRAEFWYRKAAEKGYADARQRLDQLRAGADKCFGLGFDYYDAKPPSYNEALFWFDKAARQGHAGAMNMMGVMYIKGLGARQDDGEAARWFREAGDAGEMLAQFNLGLMYENGLGVRQNLDKAKAWYRKAAGQGHDKAKQALERLSP